MSLRTDTFDLAGLRLSVGEGRRLELAVPIAGYELGGEHYVVEPELVAVWLDISRITGGGYALRLHFRARLAGPCTRCLTCVATELEVQAREVSVPAGGDELESPYVQAGVLDLRAWAHDALALTLPAQLLCRSDCAGLCPVCGLNLNLAGPEHAHAREPDARWAKLSELRFD